LGENEWGMWRWGEIRGKCEGVGGGVS
jgi:hypothetical protein